MAPLANRARQQRHQITKNGLKLKWEITIALIVKLILLWLLWDFFFSAPKAKHMRLPAQQVTQHVLSHSTDNSRLSTPSDSKSKIESVSK